MDRRQVTLALGALAAAWPAAGRTAQPAPSPAALPGRAAPAAPARPLKLVASTAELAHLAAACAGTRATVLALVPAAASAEDYVVRSEDAQRVAGADVVVRVGLDYDLWLDRLLAQRARSEQTVADCSRYVAPLKVRAGGLTAHRGHAHGSGNPHYWLDPENVRLITAEIVLALSAADEAGAEFYREQREHALAELTVRTLQWTARVARLRVPPVLAYHDTWPYFARRFGLRVVGVIEQRPGVPPGPAQLASLLATARSRSVGAVVVDVNDATRDAQFLATRLGVPLVRLTSQAPAAQGTTTGLAQFARIFEHNVAALEQSFAA